MFNPEEILPGPHLADLSEIISKRTGLNFPEERWPDLVRSIRAAAHDLGFSDTQSCIEGLLSASLEKNEIEILASHLTVGETYFFRDEKLFEALEENVLRPLIDTRRGKDPFLSLWSAGCASGEEAYSLAILVKKMIPDLENWRIVIQATDINPHFLKKARKGIYSEWSFRNTPPRFKGQYFTKTSEGRWEVLPEIRQMVLFSNHNLAEDPYPWSVDTTQAIDLIVCRNVLMYFTQEKGKDVIQGFHHCLRSEGWLVVSPWETPATLDAGFE
ncbi:MAG: chemotaxis protein CheR, partial [Deltaproteobacteria bacterium]|nr:chemotaxis protein CheR [Deltaproteobacteria bacterium]